MTAQTRKLPNARTEDLMEAFGVAHMTIYNWRQGRGGKTPLPFEVDNPQALKPRISFRPGAVTKWARENGIPYAKPLVEVLQRTKGQRQKPGPKKRVPQ